MDLWVRSQDKENLIQPNHVFYDLDEGTDAERIRHIILATGHSWLGEYSSKERCLEILDEIQSYINDINGYFMDNSNRHRVEVVFEMPEE